MLFCKSLHFYFLLRHVYMSTKIHEGPGGELGYSFNPCGYTYLVLIHTNDFYV